MPHGTGKWEEQAQTHQHWLTQQLLIVPIPKNRNSTTTNQRANALPKP